MPLGLGKPAVQFLPRDEGQVLVGEIKARFDVGQQLQQAVTQAVQRPGQAAGQLAQRDVQFRPIGSLDHTQHGLGLGQIDPAGQKRPQGELAWPRQPRPAAQSDRSSSCNKGRRSDGVNLGNRLARVTPHVRGAQTIVVQASRLHKLVRDACATNGSNSQRAIGEARRLHHK